MDDVEQLLRLVVVEICHRIQNGNLRDLRSHAAYPLSPVRNAASESLGKLLHRPPIGRLAWEFELFNSPYQDLGPTEEIARILTFGRLC